MFIAYFSTYRKMLREVDNLFSVQHQDKESLKDYMVQFKAATLEVYHLNDFLAMLALKRGLCPS